MSKQFAFDLRVARKNSGLVQSDVAHLLDVSQGHICKLERAVHSPTLEQLCHLSLVYGRSFEIYYAELLDEARANLRSRIKSLPLDVDEETSHGRRDVTLRRLDERLLDEANERV